MEAKSQNIVSTILPGPPVASWGHVTSSAP